MGIDRLVYLAGMQHPAPLDEKTLEERLASAERDAREANVVADGLQRIIAAQDSEIIRLRRENDALKQRGPAT